MKISTMLVGVLASSLALVSVAQAAPLKLDFGTAKSAVFPGFERVSDKTIIAPGAQFGFVKSAPKGIDQTRPNALAGDFVYSSRKSTFQVNLPDGQYKAWFLYGRSGYSQRHFAPMPEEYKIDINGKTAVSDPIKSWRDFYTEKYFYRGYSYIYHANDDFYEKFVASHFKEATADFSVTKGKVLFTLEDIPLNAMIIYPVDEAAKMNDAIAFLHQELRRYTIIEETKHDSINPPITYTADEQKQGYVTYSRIPTNAPLPDDHPLKEELNSTPETFVARGQKTSMAVTILPLRDLRDVRVAVSDLIDTKSGAKINAANAVALEYIAQQEVVIPGIQKVKGPAYRYEVKPTYIKPFPPNFPLMDKGVNRTLLLTVDGNQPMQPGTYEGTLTITPQNAPAKKVLLQVRVLPFTLPKLPIVAGRFAMDANYFQPYYWYPGFFKESRNDGLEDFVWSQEKEMMQWVKDVGLNSIAWSDTLRGDFENGSSEINPNGRFVRWMNLYRDMGLKAMPWYGFQGITSSDRANFQNLTTNRFSPEWTRRYHGLIESARDLGKKNNWPEVLFYLSDELSNKGPVGAKEVASRLKAVEGIPGIRTIASVNGMYENGYIGKLDAIMPNSHFPITEKLIEQVKDSKTELWVYNIGSSRFSWGYYPFRIGAKGRFQWFQDSGVGFPFDDFDGPYGDTVYSACVAGPNGPVSLLNALNMRDGLDDLRYMTLMKDLMRGKNANSKGMLDASAILKEINALNVDLRTYATGKVDAKETGFETNGRSWSSEKCEKMRWRIAEAIMELQKG